jgi:thymidylate kinase
MREKTETLPVIAEMLMQFDRAGVRYVHWKSNENIEAALAGVDDLDILVEPADRSKTEAIFCGLQVIRVKTKKDKWQSQVFHYIGLDSASNQLVHAHVHYAMPVGYDYDKNFVLPVTSEYINNRRKIGPIYVPEPEKEYAVLVLRLIIKHSFHAFILRLPHQWGVMARARSRGVVSGSGYQEFVGLRKKINGARLREVLEELFPFVPADVFKECEHVLEENKSLRRYFLAGRSLKRSLRALATHNAFTSLILSFARLNKKRVASRVERFIPAAGYKSRPATGGRIIAFAGGDGAGKSTNIARLLKTLEAEIDVRSIHVGRPEKSLAGIPFYVASRVFRMASRERHAIAWRHLAKAFDRKAAFRQARRLRSKGVVALLDRIPLAGITTMDCPSIDKEMFPKLSKFECFQYKRIKGVDRLIVLKVDPAIAVARRPSDEREELLLRSGVIWNDSWHAPYADVIDTGVNSIESVHRSITAISWDCIAKPFLRMELLGLSGVGKSTVSGLVCEYMPNTITELPFKTMYPITLLFGVLAGAPSALRIYGKTKSVHSARNVLKLYVSGYLMRKICVNKPACNLALDQGPLFYMARAITEGAEAPEKFRASITKTIPSVFYIKAPRDVISERLANRAFEPGTAQGLPEDEFEAFCLGFEQAFEQVLDQTAQHIVVADGLEAPEKLAHAIIARRPNGPTSRSCTSVKPEADATKASRRLSPTGAIGSDKKGTAAPF